MSGFRGSDEVLESEIAALEGTAKVRLRRAARELSELDRELRGLKAERARRKVRAELPVASAGVPVTAEVPDAG